MNHIFTFETHEDHEPQWAAECCGLLPLWVRDFVLDNHNRDIVSYMEDAYGFGSLYKMEGRIKSEQYISPYDEDEPLDYIAKSKIDEGTVYYFPYGIIALPVEVGHFITRMD